MILLREIQEKDLDALERFAQIPGFINLTQDRDLLREKILRSVESFSGALKDKNEGKYIFVAEDISTGRVMGTSLIAAEHGTPDSPHFYFEVGSEEKYSETINTGFIHGTLKLKYDTSGPSEIGGLVLDPEYRNHSSRVGRQISFVRFLYLALNRGKFKKKLLAELLPPLNKKGQSPLWEAIGRRFTNMDYWEADQLCQKNKEFIFSLFPTGKIYTTFLSAEARNALGKVGKDTEPVVHMLKKIGFAYKNHVDPFDGGPHFWADVDSIVPVKQAKAAKFLGYTSQHVQGVEFVAGLLTRIQKAGAPFEAVSVQGGVSDTGIWLLESERADITKTLGISDGETAVFMPYY